MLVFPSAFAFASSHTVTPGDTLYLISQNYGISVEDLKGSNNQLEGNLIYPGQTLTIPDSLYSVQPGDSLYSIGLRYDVHYEEIIRANGLASAALYPGQKLRIPTGQASVNRGNLSFIGGARYTAQDVDLLARLITAEADSESYVTKVAVGAVVLNRVRSTHFPNTIAGVIYQSDDRTYQFEPVMNGWINRPASSDAIRAAKEALRSADPTNGALYFFESWVTTRFLRARPVSVILDSFTFTF